MALNPTGGGDTHSWNYSKPENPGFSLELTGTVKAVQEIQAMNFGPDGRPTTPKFWENSNQPMMNIRIVLCGKQGGFRTLTFTPASKAAKEGKKKSIHLDLFAIAGGVNMMDLIGKTIKITTVAPPNGFNFGIGNPRPWVVEEVPGEGPYQLSEPLDPIYEVPQLLANQAVSGGVMAPAAGMSQASGMPVSADSNAPAPQATPAPGVGADEDIPF
jgi:hypothetical protein